MLETTSEGMLEGGLYLEREVFCSLDGRQQPAFQMDQDRRRVIDRICRYSSRISGPGH
jgi:hypothetical protein